MRRENSTFKASFLSQEGVRTLHNNDYHGYVELDGFACYVVADGLKSGNDAQEDLSARLAVEAVITAFNEKPSIRRGAVSKYLSAAHKVLRNSQGKERRRASVTVVVTNYQKLRYGYAGNCRFNLYRGGRLLEESRDHSLSWQMMEDGELPRDKIARHEERHNLDMYCGILKSFQPTISKKIKLKNADVFALFTRGVWENSNTHDMQEAIKDAGDNPAEAARLVDRVILDKTPTEGNVENCTIGFVFIDKIYDDPEARRRRKKIIIICIIAFIVIVIIVLVIIWFNNRRNRMREDMQIAFHNGVEYIQALNFIRARDELETAYDLAVRLRDAGHRAGITNHVMLVEAVISANEIFDAGRPARYRDAEEAFLAARNRSVFADNLAITFIERRLETVASHIDVHEFIYLGNLSADSGNFDNAQEMYLAARNIASRINYTEGRRLAIEALEALEQLRERMTFEHLEAAQVQVIAAQFIVDGDRALRDGDLVSALTFYEIARERFEALGDEAIMRIVDQRIAQVESTRVQNEQRLQQAAAHLLSGDRMMNDRQYVNARRYYLLAREIFTSLGDNEGLRTAQDRIEMLDFHLSRPPVWSAAWSDTTE